jgi:hypothetical protein
MFECSVVGLDLVLDNKCPVNVLTGMQVVRDFPGLAERLRTIDDYHWVDMYVGTHIPKGDADLLDRHTRVLSYFDAWLR